MQTTLIKLCQLARQASTGVQPLSRRILGKRSGADDYRRMRTLVRRERNLLAHPSQCDQPRKVLIYCMDYWWRLGVVEMFMHHGIRLKGHQSKMIYFDGALPLSPFENYFQQRPSARKCRRRAKKIFASFAIEPVGISHYFEADATCRNARQTICSLSDDRLPETTYRGIPIGSIALRDLFQYTLGYFEPASEEDVRQYRQHLVHAIMSVDLANQILDAEQPHAVVEVNGKTVSYSYMYEVCRQRQVPITTWEEGMYDDTSIVLAHDDRAIDFPISDQQWARFRAADVSDDRLAQVDHYFGLWRNQEATSYVYYQNENTDFEAHKRELNIPEGKRLISLFPNIIWDSNAIGKDRAFASMMDWIYSSIELVRTLPDTLLVIRPHPGEKRLRVATRTPVEQLIRARYGGVPDSVRVVSNSSELSSYELGNRSEYILIYTSTLGIEFSLMGHRPLICGVPFYADKGLTNDIVSREQFFDVLQGKAPTHEVDRDALRKFMYLTIFELVKRPEFLRGIHGHPQDVQFGIETFEGFPQSMPVFDQILNCILHRESFVQPNWIAA